MQGWGLWPSSVYHCERPVLTPPGALTVTFLSVPGVDFATGFSGVVVTAAEGVEVGLLAVGPSQPMSIARIVATVTSVAKREKNLCMKFSKCFANSRKPERRPDRGRALGFVSNITQGQSDRVFSKSRRR